jgi:hypothetical protein
MSESNPVSDIAFAQGAGSDIEFFLCSKLGDF